jgi:hypothetical protein
LTIDRHPFETLPASSSSLEKIALAPINPGSTDFHFLPSSLTGLQTSICLYSEHIKSLPPTLRSLSAESIAEEDAWFDLLPRGLVKLKTAHFAWSCSAVYLPRGLTSLRIGRCQLSCADALIGLPPSLQTWNVEKASVYDGIELESPLTLPVGLRSLQWCGMPLSVIRILWNILPRYLALTIECKELLNPELSLLPRGLVSLLLTRCGLNIRRGDLPPNLKLDNHPSHADTSH